MRTLEYVKCITKGINELEVGKIYEIVDEDAYSIEIILDNKYQQVTKEWFEPYDCTHDLDIINQKISLLENELYELNRQKESIEKDNLQIRVGSMFQCVSIYGDDEESYKVIRIQKGEGRNYIFGLLDEDNCVWHGDQYDSLEDIKEMIKDDDAYEWTITKI